MTSKSDETERKAWACLWSFEKLWRKMCFKGFESEALSAYALVFWLGVLAGYPIQMYAQ